jgi:hypothetical protein
MASNDELRGQILHYFYDRNSSATSRFGKKGSAVKISDVKRELKAEYGLSQQEVISNLTYLIDQGWVNEEGVEKIVTTKRGVKVPQVTNWYSISAPGIDKIEGESEFTPPSRYAGINIEATGMSVVNLGDGSIVNVEYSGLNQELDVLKEAIAASPNIDESQKLNLVADIESIKNQLAKPQPNVVVLSALWKAVEFGAATAGLLELADRIRPLIERLIS